MNDDSSISLHFDLNMSYGQHKLELVELLGSLMSDIDRLLLNPPKQVTFSSKVCPFKNIMAFHCS